MRAAVALALLLATPTAGAGSREIELGLENFYYRTAETPLNRDDVLGLDRNEDLARGALKWKESHGDFRAVFRGYVERSLGGTRDATTFTAREAYAQYGWPPGLQVRVGKQRIAWGSGFAWNPTNRIEPPKNPANTSLEQEGALAARVDLIPTNWAGVILVAARGETRAGDLPFATPDSERRTAALRVRFLVKDTDLAFVASGGKDQRSLLGLDLARALGGVTAHVEAAAYRGSELPPARDDETFTRLAAGVLWTRNTTSLSVEYFWNEEGYDATRKNAYVAGLDRAYTAATNQALPAPTRQAALGEYLLGATLPYAGGLGLRRHYLHAAWSRSDESGRWSAALRGAFGLEDGGSALTPGLTWSPRGNWTLSLDAVVLLGPAASEYRLAPLRAAIQARLKLLL